MAARRAYQANSTIYIDRARTLLNLAVHASSEESRSQFMVLAALYQELAKRRTRLAEEAAQGPARTVQLQALAN